MSITCQPGITIPPIGSRGLMPSMAVMSEEKRFLESAGASIAMS